MISLNLVPVHQWTHRQFNGFDPWAGNAPVRWSVVAYVLASETFAKVTPSAKQKVPSESNDIPKKYQVGIFAEAHNRYRVLPLALQEMWRKREVRDEDLPWLLHRIEEPLRRSDYPPSPIQTLLLVYTILFGLFALGGFVAYALMPHAHSKHVRQFTEAKEWAKAPLRGDVPVYLHNDVPVVRVFRLRTPLTPPSGLKAERGDGALSLLAVVQAGSEKRLALVEKDANLRSVLDDASGIVIRPKTAGLPDAAIAEMRKQYPDVNADWILCTNWDYPDTISPYDAEQSTIPLWAGAGTGAIALLSFSGYMLRRRRKQKQGDAWRELLQAHSAGMAA